MKKLLLILLCVPFIGLAQGTMNCSLLTVPDIEIDNINLSISFKIYNGNTMNANYPYIAYTIDNNGDTIQTGQSWLFITFGLDTSLFNYTLATQITPSYPLILYYVYDNLGGLGLDTCMLSYNLVSSINNIPTLPSNRKMKKVTDLLGRETKQINQPLFYIYDDGTVEKKIIIE